MSVDTTIRECLTVSPSAIPASSDRGQQHAFVLVGRRHHMARALRPAIETAVRDAVPFFVITVIWTVLMLVFYGIFLIGRPSGATYGPAIHASAFVPPFVGFLGHVVRESLRTS
jgi:hypothetical protein